MNDLAFEMLSRVRGLSPQSRRWRGFLRSLPLDPDALPQPLAEIDDRSFIVCGAPRTGTTLLSALLVQPPSILTAMEPWDGMRFPPDQLFEGLRASLVAEGAMTSGKLDLHALRDNGEVRWTREGDAATTLTGGSEVMLGVKWPIFWRYLPLLSRSRFLVCLRHPYEVISSFKRQGGRLRLGLDYDTAFNRRMNESLARATRDPARRRIAMFDYIHACILPFLDRPNVLAVRYERWFTEPEAQLREISEFLGVKLEAGAARIRRSSTPDLTVQERNLIRSECRTADALGYELSA